MKKYHILIILLFCIFNSNAEGHRSKRRANPEYKNIKVFTKVLERSGVSDFYTIQIDIVNTGDSTISFWETPSCYSWIFAFSAVGIVVISENERSYYEKKTPDILTMNEILFSKSFRWYH